MEIAQVKKRIYDLSSLLELLERVQKQKSEAEMFLWNIKEQLTLPETQSKPDQEVLEKEVIKTKDRLSISNEMEEKIKNKILVGLGKK